MALDLFAMDLTKTLNIYILILIFISATILTFSKLRHFGGFIFVLLGFILLNNSFNILISFCIIVGGVYIIIYHDGGK
jgi:hypothetical protein